MKNDSIIKLLLLFPLGFLIVVGGCSKMNDTYKDFIKDGEHIYTVNADSIWVKPGKNRILLSWTLMGDAPNVIRYGVFWNDGRDSVTGPIQEVLDKDTVKVLIDDLEEGAYDFHIYSYSKSGGWSIGRDTVVDVYGKEYIKSLYNRVLKEFKLNGSDIELIWYPADSTNLITKIWYTDQLGDTNLVTLPADSLFSTLINWDIGTKIYYKSSYKPSNNALDTFTVNFLDSVQVNNVPVSKKLWKAVKLPYDAGYRSNDPGNYGLHWLWDGQPADYPEIFYSSDEYFPLAFTIDLGKTYSQLTRIEEWGRSAGYYNPLNFEVWGIADTSNALVPVPPDDPNWKSKSLANGWILLGVVNRDPDDSGEGASGWTEELTAGSVPVRFIRIRVLKTYGNKTKTHLSELSFWYNPNP